MGMLPTILNVLPHPQHVSRDGCFRMISCLQHGHARTSRYLSTALALGSASLRMFIFKELLYQRCISGLRLKSDRGFTPSHSYGLCKMNGASIAHLLRFSDVQPLRLAVGGSLLRFGLRDFLRFMESLEASFQMSANFTGNKHSC